MSTRLDRAKMKELILYISEKCEGDPRFGLTKLNKLLYYADFIAYLRLGRPISGDTYQKLEFGPAPRSIMPIRREMEQGGELFVRQTNWYGKIQQKPVALRQARLGRFSGDEIALVDGVMAALCDLDATQVSALSRTDWGWQLAREGEAIPYETALIASIERIGDLAA